MNYNLVIKISFNGPHAPAYQVELETHRSKYTRTK